MNRNYQLGLNYYNGDNGYEENIDSAVMFFKYALDEECYEAAYMLGLCYSEALDKEKINIEEALKNMKLASNKRIDSATEWLADYYLGKDFFLFIKYYCLIILQFKSI